MDKSQNRNLYLSVIIPAYNEESRIEHTLKSIKSFLSQQSYHYEVIVVDDGSEDKTVDVVSKLISELSCIRLIDNKENRGKGWAVKQGMLNATGKIRIFMDADNSTSVDQIEHMFPYFVKGVDVVIGSRRVKGSVITVHQPWFRENIGRVFNLIVSAIFGLPVKDTQAGFKAFSSLAAEKIFSMQKIWHWAFDVELLVIAQSFGFKVKEVPIIWRNDARSNVKLKGMIKMLLDVIRIRLNLWSGAYNQRVKFNP